MRQGSHGLVDLTSVPRCMNYAAHFVAIKEQLFCDVCKLRGQTKKKEKERKKKEND